MATDIAPELYKKIKEIFDQKYAQAQLFGNSLSSVFEEIKAGNATFQTADIFAVEVGSMMAESMKEVLKLDELPDGKLYRNIAQKTIGEGLKDTYGLVSNISATIQEEINANAGIGIKAVKPKLETERVDKIVDRAVNSKTQTALENNISDTVPTFARQVVDDTQKANARLHNKAGLRVKVEREYDGVGLHGGTDVCEWCLQRAGTWTYEKAIDNGVFERHEGCGCIIEYTSKKGERIKGIGATNSEGKKTKTWEWEEFNRRKIGDQGQEIIDKPTYNKLTKKFISNGGIIIRGEDAEKHLKGRAYAAYVPGANAAFIRDDATVSDVLEEMFHAEQDRIKAFGNLSNKEMLLRREIQAQEYLISVTEKYKIPSDEIRVTEANLRDYRIQLEQYLLNK